MEKAGRNSKTAFTCSGAPSSTVSSVTCGWPTGRTPSSCDRFVEALGEQAVDDFLADFGGKSAQNDGFRHLAGAEAGNLGVFPVVGGDVAPGLGDLFGRDVDDQLAGALGVQSRAVLVVVRLLRRDRVVLRVSRFRFVFEGAALVNVIPSGRARRFSCGHGLPFKAIRAPFGRGKYLSLWYGGLRAGSNRRSRWQRQRIANVTLLFGGLGLTNVRQEAGMGCAALGVVGAGLIEAQLAVDGEAHFRGIVVFLAVVLPPANRAKLQGVGRIECLVSAARATIAHFDRRTHTRMDGKSGGWDYGGKQFTVRSS